MANGGASYGVSSTAEDGTEEVYAIPGVYQVDSNGAPPFAAVYLENLVHEFVHSYANPLVDQFADPMEKPATAIFKTVADAVRQQAYGTWKILLYESPHVGTGLRESFQTCAGGLVERLLRRQKIGEFGVGDEPRQRR
jgi:hypothetical protein